MKDALLNFWTFLLFQEKDLEVTQASLAVAHAAAELCGSDSPDLVSVPGSITGQQLDELEQLRRTVASLHEELNVLKSINTDLKNELDTVVGILLFLHISCLL